ncbi:MAG: molybdopterin cofactor-binding domain-containing protein, partial [Myxococcota bacterium]
MNRRTFMQLMGWAGGGLVLGVGPGGCAHPQIRRMTERAATTGEFEPNIFLTITPDDRVLVAMNKAEMGQGVMTGTATLVAEELEVPISQVEPFHAFKPEFETSVGEASIDTGGLIGMQLTGGSSSTPENFVPVRRAAASAREMLVAAAAAQWGVAATSCVAREGRVLHEASGRSLRYGELTRQAAQQPLVESPSLKKRSAFTQIGKRTVRTDARCKVDGSGQFGTDITLPNLVRACVIHPPTLGAKATAVESEAARAMVGVVDIFPFERGVAVVAEKYWQARRAAAAVKVTWSGGILNGLNTDELRTAALARLDRPGDHTMRDDGDLDEAMERTDVTTLVADYDVPYLAHAPMEPMNATVHVQEDKVTVWAPNQSPTVMAEAVSRVLRIKRSDVTVHTTLLGGGFGRRGVPDFVVEATLIAQRIQRPVQLIWSREDDTKLGYYRPLATFRMQGALDDQGKAVALAYRSASQSIILEQMPTIGSVFPDWIPLMGRRMMA